MNTFTDKRGTAIIIVIVATMGIAIILGSLLNYSVTEKRLNQRATLRLEAKSAAEAVVELGFAQLVQRFDSKNSFPIDALAPKSGGNPLTIPSQFHSFFTSNSAHDAKTNVVMPPASYDPFAPWGTYETELIGGVVPPGEWKFIDPAVPGNEDDKLKGRWVFVRGVKVYSKATMLDEVSNSKMAAYTSQVLQVRDAPLFSHAIFYNMPLEIAPGPRMIVNGGVHANGDMYVQSGGGLDFLSNVTATGQLFHGRNPASGMSSSSGDVRFPDIDNNLISMRDGSWLDSRNLDWAEISSDRWGGNVQTEEHQVQRQNLVQIPDYQADDPTTPAANDALNTAYEIIMPARANNDPAYNAEIEQQKFAYKAGLTVRVNPITMSYDLVTYDRDVNGNIVYDSSTGRPREVALNDSADPVAVVEPGLQIYDPLDGQIKVVSGIGDMRQQRLLNTVEVDVGKLRALVESNDESNWGGNANQKPENWWNGVVYVQAPQQADPNRPDNVVPARNNWGVKLHNGSNIPNPTFGHTRDTYGMTLATNAPLYVQGHFNADGNSSTGSSINPDSESVLNEPPAALAADAVNFLSTAWEDERSFQNLGRRNASSFTEVSAAILTGLVPSGKTGSNSYSGGVENFPRFLESWSSDTFRYRGSMVALFESEVATDPWGGTGGIYNAPNRDWGFHKKFAEGYYPPGTPNTRSYRRVDFRDMTEAQYNAALAALKVVMGL